MSLHVCCHTNTKSLNWPLRIFFASNSCAYIKCVTQTVIRSSGFYIWIHSVRLTAKKKQIDCSNYVPTDYNNTKLFYFIEKKVKRWKQRQQQEHQCWKKWRRKQIERRKLVLWFENNNNKSRMHCWNHCLGRGRTHIIFIAMASIMEIGDASLLLSRAHMRVIIVCASSFRKYIKKNKTENE